MKTAQQIRFAPIIRVSTEKQEKQGESLRKQKTDITQYVAQLGGVIPDTCWQYTGQEHATPEHERQKLDALLEDSGKGLFDAVIVCDPSRWSRDNLRNEIGLRTLRDNSIRFFAATVEYNLADETQFMQLQFFSIINQWQARTQARKSIDNRIHRAKRGIPATGELPYARTFDRKTCTWALDEQKAQAIRDVARRYLAGENLYTLATEISMTHVNLVNTLRDRCGGTWTVQFRNGTEPVTFNIPHILTNVEIDQVRQQLIFKRRWSRHEKTEQYLLSGHVRCEQCGRTLSGQTQRFKGGQAKYYQHQQNGKCKAFSSIRAERLEDAIFLTIFENIADAPSFEQAIAQSLPSQQFVSDLEDRIKKNEHQLSKISGDLNRLVDAVLKGSLSHETIQQREQSLIAQRTQVEQTLMSDREQISTLPDTDKVRKEAETIRRQLLEQYSGQDRLQAMTFTDKRQLLQWLFSGRDKQGTQYGIYINKTGKRKDSRIDYFMYGRITGLRTLKGDNIDFQEDDNNYKLTKGVNYRLCSTYNIEFRVRQTA